MTNPSASSTTDATTQLLTAMSRFLDDTVDPKTFSHHDHILIAWSLIVSRRLAEAVMLIRDGLLRLTRRAGVPHKFHETITIAFALLIAERINTRDESAFSAEPKLTAELWEEFIRANQDLLAPRCAVLADRYSNAVLWSDDARRTFVQPDRRAFDKELLCAAGLPVRLQTQQGTTR